MSTRRLPLKALYDEARAKHGRLKDVPPQYLNEEGIAELKAWRCIELTAGFALNVEDLKIGIEVAIESERDPAVAARLRAYIGKIEQ